MQTIRSLKDFYSVMHQTVPVKKTIIAALLNGQDANSSQVDHLKQTLTTLQKIPETQGKYTVELSPNKTIDLDLSYEINELQKDIYFLEQGEEKFLSHLAQMHTDFTEQVKEGAARLQTIKFKNFITDRDGTVNNYCGRYQSSVQSIYNAIFLTRFAQTKTDNAVILTSAPLMSIGLADISIAPASCFIYAGSKGREYLDPQGEKCIYPIPDDQQKILDHFNKEIEALISNPLYEKYTFIGSGLQYKFGQTTIARQDITGTIPENESKAFLEKIQDIVKSLDPQNNYFRIEDTGLDVEVILTVGTEDTEQTKDFDKGDGIKFLNQDIPLNITDGPCLICGDTASDVPMVETALDLTQKTECVFVTPNPELIQKVKGIHPQAFIVSTPDVLIAILNNIAKTE
jgi:hypothetical protein